MGRGKAKPKKESDWPALIDQMHSNEARAKLVADLAEKGVQLEGRYIDQAISYYHDKGQFNISGALAARSGMTELASQDFENAGLYVAAAEHAAKANMMDRSLKLYEKALAEKEGMRQYNAALKIAEDAGLESKAEFYKNLLASLDAIGIKPWHR